MDALFCLSGASHDRSAVDAWFERQPPGLGDRARRWFAAIRAQGPDVTELIHDRRPTACIGDAAFAYVAVHAAHVTIGFYRGSDLSDPAGLLCGEGKRMRHVKLRAGEEVDEATLAALVSAAAADMRTRLAAGG